MNLTNKVVLITGSSAGIGKETAIQFAKKGSRIIVTYNEGKEEGEKVLEECKKHSDAILLHLDVRDDDSIDKLVKETIERLGRIDILVNNAGVIRWKHLIKQSREDIEEQIKVNLLGLIKVTRAFLSQFHKQKDGIIINIASGAGKEGFSELTTYCATKFGVRGFTQALSYELTRGVRIYCVNPGMTSTRMTNYTGIAPSKVAEVILLAAEEKLDKESGDDVDVWEYVD